MSEPATLTPVPRPSGDDSSAPFGRAEVAPYARPHLGRSLLDLATSVVPYLALSVAMYFALDTATLTALLAEVDEETDEEPDFEAMSDDELAEFCEEHDITITAANREEAIEKIRAALASQQQ